MSYECDNCKDLNEEIDSLHAEVANYNAKEFINFVEAFGNVKVYYSSKYASNTKETKEFSDRCLDAYELSIAAYMHSQLDQMTFNRITMEAGVTFAQNISDIYRKVFKKDYFKIEAQEE